MARHSLHDGISSTSSSVLLCRQPQVASRQRNPLEPINPLVPGPSDLIAHRRPLTSRCVACTFQEGQVPCGMQLEGGRVLFVFPRLVLLVNAIIEDTWTAGHCFGCNARGLPARPFTCLVRSRWLCVGWWLCSSTLFLLGTCANGINCPLLLWRFASMCRP
jgi:hypothetical protein